jgi:hypothetical protein
MKLKRGSHRVVPRRARFAAVLRQGRRRKGAVIIMNTDSQDQLDVGMPEPVVFDIRHLSAEQLGVLGVSHIAYVKPIVLNGEHGFAIHAADGTPMAVAGDRDVAIAAILQHEMQPLSVH